MAWTIYTVPSAKRTELDAALRDDIVSRQSQKIRAAASLGGAADALYVLVEGSPEAIRRAEELLGAVGKKITPTESDALLARFKEEEEAASAGMGLFFTEE
jgi:hypothetical protein